MNHHIPASTEYVEVEINSIELTEFMKELQEIKDLKINLVGTNSIGAGANATIDSFQIKEEYEEPVFQPMLGDQTISCMNDFELNEHYDEYDEDSSNKTEAFDRDDTVNIYHQELNANYVLLEKSALNSVAIVKLKKLNGHLLKRFLATRKAKTNHLKTLVENHARAELYPNIKKPVTLPNNLIM
jgi:hypothetical protein